MSRNLIQAYALGGLTPEEMSEIKEMISTNPDFSLKELGKYQNLTALLPSALPVEMPDQDIKDKIARKLYRIKNTSGRVREDKTEPSKDIAKDIISRSLTDEVSEKKKIPTGQNRISPEIVKKSSFEEIRLQPASKLKQPRSKFFYIPLALVAGLIAGFFLFYENKDSYINQINGLNAEIEALNSELVVNSTLLNLLEKKDTRIYSLKGSEIYPDGFGKIYVNSSSNRAYLYVSGLQELNEKSTYQIWVRNGGKTYSAGMFNVDPSVKYYSLDFPIIDYDRNIEITVTEENSGGSLKPGRKIHLAGSN